LFFLIPFISSGILSVFTNRNTDGVSNGINLVGKYHPKIPMNFFLSVISFVFVDLFFLGGFCLVVEGKKEK
jgi:hypothetical protein